MNNKYWILPLLYIFFISCIDSNKTFENAIYIENINLIDAEDGLRLNQTLIIKEGRIIKIANSDSLQLSRKNNIINGTGKYIIPGLWDAHMHFAYIEELAPYMFDLFLAHGVTSVRDTGGEIDFVKYWKDQSKANPYDTPRVMIAGPLLDGIKNVYDGNQSNLPKLSIRLNSIESVKKEMERLYHIGVDFFKAYEMLSPEQFNTVIEVANQKGLKVTGHVPLSMDVISVSNAGLHSMEHMRNLEFSCAKNANELLLQRRQMLAKSINQSGANLRASIHKAQQEIAIKNYDEAKADTLLSVLKKNNTWQIPTLALNTLFTRQYFADENYQQSYLYLPDSIATYWQKRSIALKGLPISDFRKIYDNWNRKMVKKIHDYNIPIMAGTDSPIAYLTPGRSLHKELAALVDAGLSPIEVIKTATLNPAKYFNLENKLGLIKEGYLADLVVLNANPLESIENTLNIDAVIKQGRYHNRKTLDLRLEQLKH